MELPQLEFSQITLPFDVPVLLHPAIVHFVIVLPIIILLLEFYNLFARKKTVGGFSFILIILTVVAFAGAYFTGLVDGKEAGSLLSAEGKKELLSHKLLGTYLLIGSAVLLFFKLLSLTGKKLFKFLFFFVLIGFIVATLKQGKEGGELVYEHGANVEKVKSLDDDLLDANEELKEIQEKLDASKAVTKTVPAKEATPAVSKATPTPVNEVNATVETVVPSEEKSTSSSDEESTSSSDENVSTSSQSETNETKPTDDNASSSFEKAAAEMMKIVPSDAERPKIATH